MSSSRRAPRLALALSLACGLAAHAPPSRADDGAPASRPDDGAPASRPDDGEPPRAESRADTEDLARDKEGYTQLFATAFFGDGLRFNNPYRLATPLGDSAESVSRTAMYVDVGFAMSLFGRALGLQHGPVFRMTAAVEGVGQVVVTPGYQLYRRYARFAAWGRVGLPMPLTPEVTWGGELAAGGAWFFLGGVGVAGELVGDVFYGAGTRERAVPAYPVLSAQLGLVLAYEVLP